MKLRHRFITAASVLALAGAGMRADAQIIMSYAVDSPQLSFIWQNTDKFDVLDSAYLTVTYREAGTGKCTTPTGYPCLTAHGN